MNGKKRRKYEAVFFDKDGVLIDSFDVIYTGVNEARKHYGLRQLTRREFIDQCWGKMATVERNAFEASSKGELKERYGYYRKKRMEIEHNTKLYPATLEVLDSLKGKVKMAVITNTFREVTLKVLGNFDLTKYFDVIVGGDDAAKPKPAPDLILKACNILGVSPKETLYIGDTKPDIDAGKAAGCDVVMLTTSLSREELEGIGDIEDITIISDLKDLLEIVT
jgi:HAD superfamily hydrolase (TIGR01509 family)